MVVAGSMQMQQERVNKPRLIASYLLAFSMMMLAVALVYFAKEMADISRQIPGILQVITDTSEKIQPVTDEVDEIKQLIPPLLLEIEESRKLVKAAIEQYAISNQHIPRILDEVAAARQALPQALKTVDGASAAVIMMSKEIEAGRPLIPEILQEVEKTRESIPAMLDRADQLVANARTAGKEASQGAVTGVFSGILMAPFDFVGNVGERLVGRVSGSDAKKLGREDYALIEKASSELLARGKKGEVKGWENERGNNSGTVKLLAVTEEEDEEGNVVECRKLYVEIRHKNDIIQALETTVCKDEAGKWAFE